MTGALASLAFTVTPARRTSSPLIGWVLAVAPALAFAGLVAQAPAVLAGEKLVWEWAWMPALGVRFSLYLDGLSLLFGLLVSGIGALVVVYAGYYFKGQESGRFLLYLLLFMTAMLGLVLAGDVIALFVFWEGTSLTSFLLIAYKTKDLEARKGAFKALFVTGSGGIALLAGLLFAAAVAGSTDLATILKQGDALRASPWYPVIVGLIALGAFTKSAQFPFHFWLPSAMSAPTPASTYLHAATMVKAGIYLLARLHPALGNTALWDWLLASVGLITMVTGALVGLRQADLKAVLAYSTVSQLGALTMLIGEEAPSAFKALVIGVLAHALYKGAMFMVAGIVDHSAGTRDLRRLGGLVRVMPMTFTVALLAGLSMAGLPPLFGFLAKESLLAAEFEPVLPPFMRAVQPVATVLTGALMLAQAGTLVLDTFITPPGAGFKCASKLREAHETHCHPHEAPLGMVLAPGLLALLSLVITVLQPEALVDLLARAASAAYGAKVKVSLELFHGVNLPLVLSGVAIAGGVGLFAGRAAYRAVALPPLTLNRAYDAVLSAFDCLAALAVRTQNGRIRTYLTVILLTTFGLVFVLGQLDRIVSAALAQQMEGGVLGSLSLPLNVLRAFSLLLAVAAAFVSVVIRRDLLAIIALSSSGLAVAVLIALEPSPDVALVQVIVDLLSTVILVLAISRLPRAQRRKAESLNGAGRRDALRGAVIAIAGGAIVSALSFYAFASRPRESVVTPFYEQNSKPLTGAADIVGAIVVDFRGFDTMIEITVFSVAGLGVFTLLRLAMKKRESALIAPQDSPEYEDRPVPPEVRLPPTIRGIDGARTSPFVRALAYVLLPLAFVLAFVQMVYGHDQPGDGFTAGVTLSLAVGFWYVVFGYEHARGRLTLLKPGLLIGAGILTVMLGSAAPMLFGKAFFSPYNFGHALGLPLPEGFDLTTSLLFELAICLAVLGASVFILDTLGHPERDLE
ncbi:MAG: DUF4040 domain-containing protein [Thermoflexales bacterium]|nr:DUF4040 domain-containing protein [Thermoflexales bacterium]